MENILKIFTTSHNFKEHNIKRIILAALFFLTFTSFMNLYAQWAKTYRISLSGLYSSRQGARSIQQTSDGGYIVAGHFEGGSDPSMACWKLTSVGDIEWIHSFGGTGDANSIQQTSDGGYIVAGYLYNPFSLDTDIRVLKLTSVGDIEWECMYDNLNGGATSIQQTNDGGYIVTGWIWYSNGIRNQDILILKLASDGNIEWQRTYGGSNYDKAFSIQQTSDGGYIVAGHTTSTSFGAGGYDFWILKLDSNGDIEWQRSYGGSEDDWGLSIQQTNDGGYIVTGKTESFGAGEYDFWILKLDSNGDIEWQRTYGGIYNDSADSIQQTSDGGYIVAGETQSFGSGREDFWILKLGSNGDIEWQRTFGGGYEDYGSSIQQTSSGGYIVAGHTQSFDAAQDILILKLSSDGDIPSCELIVSSNATVADTSITPIDSDVVPQDTNITPEFSYFNAGEMSATVTLLCGAEEEEEEESDEDGGGFKLPCFIATAAYGSPLHPHIDILRDFRDKYLMPNKIGRKLVGMYYKYSPFVANLIAKYKALKVIVRNQLIPLIVFSYSMIHFGPIITAIILFCIFSLPVFIIFRY